MKILFRFFFIVLAVVVLLAWAFGSLTKKISTYKETLFIAMEPEDVWGLLTDSDKQVFWRSDLVNVTRKPVTNRLPVYTETFRDNSELEITITEFIPFAKYVREYNPSWTVHESMTYLLVPDQTGCRVAFLQSVRVTNPFVRLFILFGWMEFKDDKNRALVLAHMLATALQEKIEAEIITNRNFKISVP